jgi:hypothetical protein
VLDDFAEMNESDEFDPFADTAKARQVASRQSEYQNRRFDREEAQTRKSLLFARHRRWEVRRMAPLACSQQTLLASSSISLKSAFVLDEDSSWGAQRLIPPSCFLACSRYGRCGSVRFGFCRGWRVVCGDDASTKLGEGGAEG